MEGKKIGTFFETGSSSAIECMAAAGLDYVIIDTEHGFFSEESTAEFIRAAENRGLAPYVRIGDIRRPYVLRMADIGARALIVPNIRSVEEVKTLVSHAKFPPVGGRGFCPNRTTAWGADDWGKDVFSYMAECNRRLKLIPQCETKEALQVIDEITALEGVDGIFVGPCDLSIALGIPLQFESPVLLEAVEKILESCKRAGKESIIFAGSAADAARWYAMGFDSVAYSLDTSVLTSAYQEIIKTCRQ